MMNVGINQVSAVLRAPYGLFTAAGDARDLMSAASREVIAISRKLGINLSEEDIEKYVKVLETISPLGKTSMLQDVEAGRKTEVESFAGTVIKLGRQYGVETPVNGVLFKMIKAIFFRTERMNKKSKNDICPNQFNLEAVIFIHTY
jgi:2-dehydropantoate 2-reductase